MVPTRCQCTILNLHPLEGAGDFIYIHIFIYQKYESYYCILYICFVVSIQHCILSDLWDLPALHISLEIKESHSHGMLSPF